MKKFSQRYGYTPAEHMFQRERIDDRLRISIWNVLNVSIWDKWEPSQYGYTSPDSERINALVWRLWFHHFSGDMDALPPFRVQRSSHWECGAYDKLKDYFFRCKWYEVYNFIEFLAQDRDTFIDDQVRRW